MATEVKVPDIGDFEQVEVIEVLVAPGDNIDQETPLITLESDKAAMDIPSPAAGTVEKVHVKAGDKVSKGDLILTMAAADNVSTPGPEAEQKAEEEKPATTSTATQSQPDTGTTADIAVAPPAAATSAATQSQPGPGATADIPVAPAAAAAATVAAPAQLTAVESRPYASPTVRRLARELGADLRLITGTGPKQRITKDDVKQFIRSALKSGIAAGSTTIATPAPAAEIDFSQYGATETETTFAYSYADREKYAT